VILTINALIFKKLRPIRIRAFKMKKIVLNYLVITSLAVAAVFTSCGGSVGGFSNAKWEYKVFDHNTGEGSFEELNKKLNELGAEGWELVSSGTCKISGGYHSSNVLYLKRKL